MSPPPLTPPALVHRCGSATAHGAADLLGVRVGTDETSVLRILDGRTGALQFETALDASARWSPFAADIDADGHAELLVPGGAPREGVLPSVTILHQSNDTWAAAGPVWPTRDFQLSSVGAAGEIPRGETLPPSWAYNVFHARPAVDPAGTDLSIQDASVCWDPCAGTVTIAARVGNGGPGATVETGLVARAGSSVVANVPVPALEAGVLSDELQLTIPGTAFDGGQVVLSVDPEAVVVECDEGDNEVVLADPR